MPFVIHRDHDRSYHADLNLLTVHGKSRFPGLHVWLADGRRVAVAVPPGCLLVQVGLICSYVSYLQCLLISCEGLAAQDNKPRA
jgi:hypothetical protein